MGMVTRGAWLLFVFGLGCARGKPATDDSATAAMVVQEGLTHLQMYAMDTAMALDQAVLSELAADPSVLLERFADGPQSWYRPDQERSVRSFLEAWSPACVTGGIAAPRAPICFWYRIVCTATMCLLLTIEGLTAGSASVGSSSRARA